MWRVKNEKEFLKWKNKKPIKGSTKAVKKIPISKGELAKQLDDMWRDKILAENDYRCRICGQEAGVVHHFIRKSRSFILRYNPDNLIPLCAKCHSLIHCFGQESIMTGILIGKQGQEWFDKLLKIKQQPIQSSIRTKKYLEEKLKELNEIKNL